MAVIIEPKNNTLKLLLVVICALVLAITLSAGLWPFSTHIVNNISWSAGGLHFGEYGIVVSQSRFNGMATGNGDGCSMEIWIAPDLSWDSNTILAFYNTGNGESIQVRQSGDDLVFSRSPEEPFDQAKQKNVYVDNAFQKGEDVLITLTSANGHLNIYLNGTLKKTAKNVRMASNDFAGILLLGDSPRGHASFTGTYRGIAFYDRVLSPEEILQNHAAWTRDRQRIAGTANHPFSLYLFNEQKGDILHNTGIAGPDLVIPKHYFVFEPAFLVPFWKEFEPCWCYVKDLAINVFGLMPLGACFAALFAWLVGRKHALLYASLLGFCVSLTIETLQSFLPTRSSGTTDLITNTLGSALGAWLYLNVFTQSLLKRWGVVQ